MVVLIFFFVHWYLSLFFQTFFLHRYTSHRMFKMTPLWEKIFFLLTFIFQGSSFLHPAAYGMMHRNHHSYADTPKDPHSPVHLTNIISFNFATVSQYRKLVNEFMHGQISANDVPRWFMLERIGESLITRVGFMLIYVLFYIKFASAPWQYALLPFHFIMGPMHGFIVNWFGHKKGYRNFDDIKDNSKNTLPIDFLMMGELYQNNHHKRPNDLNFAVKWFELDFGYIVTLLLKKIRVIY
ncbi:MAG: fatty acid desaturase [Candidatus Neomarinimicrobiota bacterium]